MGLNSKLHRNVSLTTTPLIPGCWPTSTILRRYQHQPAFSGLTKASNEFCSCLYLCLENLVLAQCSVLRNSSPGASRGLSHRFHSSTGPSTRLTPQSGQERPTVPQTEGQHSQTVQLHKQIVPSPCFLTQTGKDPAINAISPTNQP